MSIISNLSVDWNKE